ncbi:oxidoreductase [Cystobasidium minutum MCA 4210]|uniref:oxidoreductase n=1 Tax=Cystobasidium minutum MCA 4210 TaxID=1397322 RepID=UPI0034CD1ED0|eukprot:jgi/Rhomi1/79565/CE79564_671
MSPLKEPQVVLITGCSSGIGHALANELLSRGCIVYAASRRVEAMETLKNKGAHLLALDVANKESCEAAVQSVLTEQGRMDILINNAGTGGTGPLLEFDVDAAAKVFETNTLAPLRMAQLVSRSMVKRRAGLIVNIGSVVGEIPTAWSGIYNASKAALHSLTRTLEMEVAGFGVHVMLVAAGGVKSGFGEQQTRSFAPVENSLYASNLDTILWRATAGQTTAIPAEEFARRLADKILVKPSSKLASYVSFGGRALQMAILRWLPWWIVRRTLMRVGNCYKIGK